MDFLSRSYASLLEQSRGFYFPPLGGLRSAAQEARPPAASSAAPFLELGLGRGRGEREIPLDLSTKTPIRQGAEGADGDVIVLEHRRRNHLQLAAALAAGKLPFAFGAQGGPFLAGPHLSMFQHDAPYRCAADGSAFLTPPSNLHSAICGGLNGFCLDPHRCRIAAINMAAAASAPGGAQAAFQAAPPYAVFERHLAKMAPSYADLSSAAAPSTGELLKQQQQHPYLAPYLGLPTYSKEATPTSCAGYLPGPYQVPCACCYGAAPPRGYEAHPFAAPALLPRDAFAQDAKDKASPKTSKSPGASPLKPQAEGGRWIAHPHSHHAHKDKMAAEAPPTVKCEAPDAKPADAIDRWMLGDDKSRAPQAWNPAEVKREFNVVAPVVARVAELPASPAEGCAPVSAEPKTSDASLASGFRSESPLRGVKEEQPWKTPLKRAPSDLGPLPSKKKRKKDVIVISMRDDHQGHREVLMKSVKRKLSSEVYVAPPADSAVKAALLGLAAHHFHVQRPLAQLHEEKPAEAAPPGGALTLAKSALPGPVQYSVLNGTSAAANHKSNEDTSAMLRLYYEQQKQRLQDTVERKRALTPPQPRFQPQQQQPPPPPSFRKQEEEEARDGDDEREDDNEEDAANDAKRRRIQGKDGGLEAEERRGTNENIENEKNANNHIQPPISEPVTPPTPSTAPSISVSPIASRVESTKRLMINKALGETTLHRAARLGYLDILSYCLENQAISIDARDNAGYTPLHECCSRGHLEIARQLLQHGADPNASAAGGVRPIHDAIEYDRLEIVRLLLSYGADPVIATYSGLTPLKMARSPIMVEFLKGYLADINGESDSPVKPWQFHGSASFFDPWPTGYDPLLDLPSEDESSDLHEGDIGDDDDVDNGAALIFEVSDKPHIPTYRVPASRRNGSGMLRFCLLQDVLHQTAMDRDAFLSCYPDIQVATMPRQEFAARAKCTQLMVDVSGALEACPSSPWVEFVHWDDTIRDILDIERVSIPRLDD